MKMKGDFNAIQIWIILIVVIFFNNYNCYSQGVDEYELKAVYILNFSLFTEWPSTSTINIEDKPFVITIYGKNPFEKKIEYLVKVKRKKLKNRIIIIKYANNLNQILNSDIIFISSSEKYNVSKIINYVRGKPILTIGDTKGYLNKGVMINMYISNSKLKFDINLKEVKKSDIYISSKLLVNANKIIK